MLFKGSLVNGQKVKTSLMTIEFDYEKKYKIENNMLHVGKWNGFLYVGRLTAAQMNKLDRMLMTANVEIGHGNICVQHGFHHSRHV